jgi:lipoate---protein ligase
MRLLDLSFKSPERNLALDEAMLNAAEEGLSGETLRFWESPVHFVVLGVSQVLEAEAFEEACAADGIPILRRCSAGGCVLQGPGCLNFSLVLSTEDQPEIQHIRSSYRYILGLVCRGLATKEIEAQLEGVSDLAVQGMKVSGNAQKRRRGHILHHGTLLYSIEPQSLSRYLREPEDRPSYRGERRHEGFVTTLPLELGTLREALCSAFCVASAPAEPLAWELAETDRLVSEKYGQAEWIRRR